MTVTPPEHGSSVPNSETPVDPAPTIPRPKPPNIHVSALIVWRHQDNMSRLFAGTEPKFTSRK